MSTRLAPYLLVVVTGYFLACAEIGAPPGGEEDKTGPVILGTVPGGGMVNVPPTDKIVINFSESIQRPNSGQALFLSPRQIQPPKISWKSDRIEIKLTDSLAPNQTYVISLSGNITDLRNNKIDSLAPIAFSTGPALDSGFITGDVLEDRKAMGGIVVALYDSLPPDSIPFDSTYPIYLTSSNTDGRFMLRYLPPQPFYLIAFQDKNNNGLFNPASERFAVPDRLVSLQDTLAVTDLRLQMAAATPRTAITDVAYTVDGLVRLRFLGPVSTHFLTANPSEAQIYPIGDSSRVRRAFNLAQSHIDTARLFDIWFGPLDTGTYAGAVRIDSAAPPLLLDTFEVKAGEDKAPPRIVANTPAPGSHFREDLVLSFAFSEPVDTARLQSTSFALIAGEADTVPLGRRWSDIMHLQLLPPEFNYGTRYRLIVAESTIVDLHGNPVGDSLLNYAFATYSPDSVGTASGDVALQEGVDAASVRLQFVRTTDKQSFSLAMTGSRFSLPLPAGRYLLSGYLDTDGDGRFFRGSVYPYRPAETMSLYPDTIAVRARFETAGIHFDIR